MSLEEKYIFLDEIPNTVKVLVNCPSRQSPVGYVYFDSFS